MKKKKRTKRKKWLYPEPGTWVADRTNLIQLEPPGPLPDGTLSCQELRDEYIAYEGLGFCIYEYIPEWKIADRKLGQLWETAQQAMLAVVEYLEQFPDPVEPPPKRKKKKKKRRAVIILPQDTEPLDLGESISEE